MSWETGDLRSGQDAFPHPEMLSALRERLQGARPAGAVVLGSGLGVLLDYWKPELSIDTRELPAYPRATVPGHQGRIALVRWGESAGLVFQGRLHFYEGRGRDEITLSMRIAAALGARWALLTNASGSVDPLVPPGTIVVVEDHFRLFLGGRAARPSLAGPCRIGSPYDPKLSEEAFTTLGREGLRVQRGVLFGGLGPSYETAAEVEMIRRVGATVACMSTVIEAEEAFRAGLAVAALSMVTNWATGLAGERLSHEEVMAAAKRIAVPLARGIDRLVRQWPG